MNRGLLITCLLAVSFYTPAQQGVNFLKESDGFWDNIELQLTERERRELVKELEGYETSKFRFLHFNADTFPDIIYHSEDQIEVLLYHNGKYRSIGHDKGKIIGIAQNKPLNVTTCHFIQDDCCDNGEGYYQQWIIVPSPMGLTLNKLERIYFAKDTEIPTFLNINLKFNVKDRSVLYNSPATESNKVEEYMKTYGYALSSKIDDKNKIWWFVIMDPKTTDLETLISGKRMGWMKSENLQVVSR